MSSGTSFAVLKWCEFSEFLYWLCSIFHRHPFRVNDKLYFHFFEPSIDIVLRLTIYGFCCAVFTCLEANLNLC